MIGPAGCLPKKVWTGPLFTMNAADFESLYNSVAIFEDGWETAIINAWPCLNGHQKQLLSTIPLP